MSEINFYLNGKNIKIKNPPFVSLASFIRRELTGTKIGCEKGYCGACTVLLSFFDHNSKKVVNRSINACLCPLPMVDSCAIVTVEALGKDAKNVHPIQKKIVEKNGTQCGFCTPGFVMSLYALIRSHPNPTEELVEEFVSGNLCRCTGYRSILDAGKTLVDPKERICPSTGKPCKCSGDENQEEKHECKEEDCSFCFPKHAIFPFELKKRQLQDLNFTSDEYKWFRPTSLESLVKIKKDYPNARLINGFTIKQSEEKELIHIAHIPEFNIFKVHEDGVLIGGSLTITSCIDNLMKIKDKKGIPELLFQLKHIASTQIRNIGSIAGSLACGYPVASLGALLSSMKAEVNVYDCVKQKVKPIKVKDLYKDLYKTILKPRKVIKSIFVPFMKENEFVQTYKQAHRNTFDWSYVISGMRAVIETEKDKKFIKEVSLYFGGLDKIIKNAKSTEEYLIGKELTEETLKNSLKCLKDDFPIKDIIWGKEEYKFSLAEGFYQKFFYYLNGKQIDNQNKDLLSRGEQTFDVKNKNSFVNTYGILQTQGEATYVGDLKEYDNELHAAPVLSKFAHGEIINIGTKEALKVEGVVEIITYKDIPSGGKNITNGEELLRSKEVTSVGQMIAIVVAKSREIAYKAAKLVNVEHKELEAIFTIEESIKKKTFAPAGKFEKGNVKQQFPNTLKGTVESGGQEHYYLETNACVAIPTPEELIVYATAQHISSTHQQISELLNVSRNKVVVKVKRIGGGFGGKETGSIPVAAAASLAASLLKKPVRMVLDRDSDILITGQRHPYHSEYTVSFDNDGKILAFEVTQYSNAGCSFEVSPYVMDASLRNCDGAYNIPNMKVEGFICKTNTPSNVAFRGFGSPQGLFIVENMMDQVAHYLKKDPNEIRFKNLYHSEDVTHHGDVIKDCTLERMWKELLEKSDFEKRRNEIEKFNKENEFKKRSIYMNPTKHGVGMPEPIYQGSSLVHIYNDGSVLISCGGIEMGQGLYTKLVQIAAKELQIPTENIRVNENSTDKLINAPPSGGSSGSDLWGSAVMIACKELAERIAPFRKEGVSFSESIGKACMARVNLTCQGFFAPKANAWYRYFVYGVGCSEVEVDILTGGVTILRSDLIMDLGDSLNPLIDLGQVEGGFLQGMGLFCLEEFIVGKNGKVTSLTEKYKIPTCKDIPKDFRVHLLSDSKPKESVILSSKGVGEPPLFLGATVYFALKNLIQQMKGKYIELSSPLTVDKVKLSLN